MPFAMPLMFLDRNLAFLSGFSPQLALKLEACRASVTVSEQDDLLFDGRLALGSVESNIANVFKSQLVDSSRLSVPRVENSVPPLELPALARNLVDFHGGLLLANLPNLHATSAASKAEPRQYASDLLVVGSLMLLPFKQLLEQQESSSQVNSITVVDADERQLLALLARIDFEEFVTLCRNLKVGFHLIVEAEPLVLKEVVYEYFIQS